MKRIIAICVIVFPSLLYAQSKQAMVYQLETSVNQYGMTSINEFINQRLANFPESVDVISSNEISMGYSFGFSTGYQFLNRWCIGVFTSFESAHNDTQIETTDIFEGSTASISEKYKVSCITMGLDLSFKLTDIVLVRNKVERLESFFSLGSGFIFSKLEYHSFSRYASNRALGFMLKGSFNFGLITLNNNLFSSLGISIGYQFSISSSLDKNYDSSLSNLNLPNDGERLDFSGFNFGVYLKLAK